MKYILYIFLSISFFIILISCKSNKKLVDEETKLANYNEVKAIVINQGFRFDAELAFPFQTNEVIQTTNSLMRQTDNANGRFVLSGNNDYMILNNNRAKAELSFFGELRNPNYSNTRDTSININNVISDLEIREENKKNRTIFNFRVTNPVEQFVVKLTVYSKSYATLFINGSNRTTIRYSGKIASIKE